MFNLLTQPLPARIVLQQRTEAERLQLEHAAAAEHHLALAQMYEARINRLDTLQPKGQPS